MARTLIGLTGFYGPPNSGKSLTVSASIHYCCEELTQRGILMSKETTARLLAALSFDQGILDFFSVLDTPATGSLTRALVEAKIEGISSPDERVDKSKNKRNPMKPDPVDLVKAQILKSTDPIVRGLLDRDPGTMNLLASIIPGIVIQTEQLEYAERPNTAYAIFAATPGSHFLERLAVTLNYSDYAFNIQEWGPLALFGGLFTPSVICSWNDPVMIHTKESLAATTRLSKGGVDLNSYSLLEIFNNVAVNIGSSVLVEMRDQTGQDLEDTNSFDTRTSGVFRLYFALSETTSKTTYLLDRPTSDQRPPSVSELSFHYVRSRAATFVVVKKGLVDKIEKHVSMTSLTLSATPFLSYIEDGYIGYIK